MATLDFPSSPTLNQIHNANGKTWFWDGSSWLSNNTVIPVTSVGTGLSIVNNTLNLTPTPAYKNAVNVYSNNQSIPPTTLVCTTNVDFNVSLSNNFKLLLTANCTLSNPTNATDGMVINIRIKQDSTGNKTLAFGNKYKWPGGIVPTVSTAANSIDFISMYYDATDDMWQCVMQKGFA